MAPLWLRAISVLAGALTAASQSAVFKVLWEVVTSVVYFASKVPFCVKCLAAQRGSRVRRDVAYGEKDYVTSM